MGSTGQALGDEESGRNERRCQEIDSASDDTTAERVGCTIREKRRSLGLTLEQLAERTDISPKYLGEVERGRRDPSISTLHAVARGLGEPVGAILGDVRELSSGAREVALLFSDVPPAIQNSVLGMLRAATR